MKRFLGGICFAGFVSLACSMPVQAQTDAVRAAESDAMSTGEVRNIDLQSGKLTIRHGPIVNLDMAAMTMSFRMKEPAALDSLKVGDKIRFVAERVNGSLMVTHIEMAE